MLPLDINTRVYEAVVDNRLEHVQRYLWNVRHGAAPSPMIPLWNVRALQDESRQAGFKDFAEICKWLEQAIVALDTQQEGNTDKLVTQIVRLSGLLKQRVHGIACNFQTMEEQ